MERLQHVDGPTFRKWQLLIQTSRYCTSCTRSHNLGIRLLHAPTSTHPWPQPPPTPPTVAGAISSHDAVQTRKTSASLGNRTWPSCFKASCHWLVRLRITFQTTHLRTFSGSRAQCRLADFVTLHISYRVSLKMLLFFLNWSLQYRLRKKRKKDTWRFLK